MSHLTHLYSLPQSPTRVGYDDILDPPITQKELKDNIAGATRNKALGS